MTDLSTDTSKQGEFSERADLLSASRELLSVSPSESPSLVPSVAFDLHEAELLATKVVKCLRARNRASIAAGRLVTRPSSASKMIGQRSVGSLKF